MDGTARRGISVESGSSIICRYLASWLSTASLIALPSLRLPLPGKRSGLIPQAAAAVKLSDIFYASDLENPFFIRQLTS